MEEWWGECEAWCGSWCGHDVSFGVKMVWALRVAWCGHGGGVELCGDEGGVVCGFVGMKGAWCGAL